MAKIILLAVALWLLITIVKRYRNSIDRSGAAKPQSEDMVQCAECGVHLPKSDSVLIGQQHYCCIDHSKEASSKQTK